MNELALIPPTPFIAPCTVMLIRDCPQDNEVKTGKGYSSQSARMDYQLLEAAGISTKDMFSTYVVNFRPPSGDLSTLFWKAGVPVDGYSVWGTEKKAIMLEYAKLELLRLQDEIARVRPKVIVVTGKWGLYFLTGETTLAETLKSTYGTLLKWRVSCLSLTPWWDVPADIVVFPVIPFNPTWEMPDKVFLARRDITRLATLVRASKLGKLAEYSLKDESNFIVLSSAATKEDFATTYGILTMLLLRAEEGILPLSIDVETIAYSYIDCLCIAWNSLDVICIPFECKERAHYWNEHQEQEIYKLLRLLFLHPNVRHWGQNYHYDAQYFLRNLCLFVQADNDSLVMNHTLFSVMEKRLDFLSSLYCKVHRYWKGNGKIDAKTKKRPSNQERWMYNCRDGVITYEIIEALQVQYSGAPKSLQEAYEFQMHQVSPAVFRMMFSAVNIDAMTRDRQVAELLATAGKLEQRFNFAMMQEVNLKSPQQLQAIFYDLFKCPKVWKDTKDTEGNIKKALTLDEDVLHDLWDTQPILRSIIDILLDYKKLTKTAAGLSGLTLDIDGKLRTMYSVSATDTYRFNSKSNAFGTGNNLQVISKGDKLRDGTKLPNTKKIFIPPAGHVFFDIDLSAADARHVAAISRCDTLLDILESGEDLYTMILREFLHDPTIQKSDYRRQIYKQWVHLTNYLGSPSKAAVTCGMTVHESEKLQRYYFGKFPEIQQWHKDLYQQVHKRNWIENVFGFRRYFFDLRLPTIMNVAAAWSPQSATAIGINKGMCRIMKELPDVVVRMQTHDSVAGTFPENMPELSDKIVECCRVVLPYARQMVIPVECNTSVVSWGDIG